jgi:hypothetical protein
MSGTTETAKEYINITNSENVLYNEFSIFLELYIHNILYLRNVYPRDAFHTYDIYNIKLKYILDDEVSKYITEVNLNNYSLSKALKASFTLNSSKRSISVSSTQTITLP